MAFKISDGMSIYQLGAGINAVLPVVVGEFHSSRYHLARKIEHKIREYSPKFVINDKYDGVFTHFVEMSIGGMKIADALKPVIVYFSLLSLVLSIALMVVATIHPLLVFGNVYIFIYVACAICIAPIMYYGWRRYLSYLIELIAETEFDEIEAKHFCACFDVSKKVHESSMLLKRDLQAMKRRSLEISLAKFRHTIISMVTLSGYFRWKSNRRVEKILKEHGITQKSGADF